MAWGTPAAMADIFERIRPSDTVLREVLSEDRADFYFQTSGLDRHEQAQHLSDVKGLDLDGMTRPNALRDMDAAFDKYLIKELRQDKDYRGYVSLRHPLLLLEYSSPVMADILKHYTAKVYARIAIEASRLSEVERAAEGRVERLSRQSERECLRSNQALGLVEAMRVCQKAPRPFDALTGVGGAVSLSDGRRRIHILVQALERLGLDKKHIDRVVEIAGDQVISDDSYQDILPAATFNQKFDSAFEVQARRWRDALEKFQSSGRTTVAALEELSWPGVPVTARTLAGLDLLDGASRQIALLKLADAGALAAVEGLYRQAGEYLGYCLLDPALSQEFKAIVLEKKQGVENILAAAKSGRQDAGAYKELLAALAEHADIARKDLAARTADGAEQAGVTEVKEMLLNF